MKESLNREKDFRRLNFLELQSFCFKYNYVYNWITSCIKISLEKLSQK